MRYISLFAGIGGLDVAIDALGGECWVQVEKEPYCRSILDLRGALSPDWVEWLMNLPIGWTNVNVDDPGPLYGWEEEPDIPRVGLGINNRSKRLTALGNAVIPAQAVFAWNRLTERLA